MNANQKVRFGFYIGLGMIGRTPQNWREGTAEIIDRDSIIGARRGYRVRVIESANYRADQLIDVLPESISAI